MYDESIKLVKVTSTTDAYGDQSETKTERTVFAELKSIGTSEFYQAQSVGFKPELKFVLADYLDYKGEEIVKYKPEYEPAEEEYKVIRTYRNKNNEIEITCKKGVD